MKRNLNASRMRTSELACRPGAQGVEARTAFLHPVEMSGVLGLHMIILGGKGHTFLVSLRVQRGFVHLGKNAQAF